MTPETLRCLPRDRLLFYVADDVTPQIRERVRQLVSKVANTRQWLIGPPQYVDLTEDSATRREDLPVETVGGELEVCSAHVPGGLPADVDARHCAEVDELVQAVRRLSEEVAVAFEFMYGGNYAGAIEAGKIDKTLQVGLLDEWHKRVL
ncbi:hypothetical protein [Rhizobacter sp. P5_C2]